MGKQKLKVITTFSGIGMQERGLENTNLYDLDIVNTCETDIYAIISYAAIHNNLTPEMVSEYSFPSREIMAKELIDKHIGYDFIKKKEYAWKKKIKSKKDTLLQTTWLACQLNKNVGDITRVETFPYCDLFTFSFPCTDLSTAGKQKGMIKGKTRSGLVYEVLRILGNMKEKPRFMLMENVSALINKTNLPAYEALNKEFEKLGYNVTYKVLEGSLAGVAQHRERIFALYYRKEENLDTFKFPLPFDCNLVLKDILHKDVPDKYFIKNDTVKVLLSDLVKSGKIKESDYDIDENVEYEMIRNIRCKKYN